MKGYTDPMIHERFILLAYLVFSSKLFLLFDYVLYYISSPFSTIYLVYSSSSIRFHFCSSSYFSLCQAIHELSLTKFNSIVALHSKYSYLYHLLSLYFNLEICNSKGGKPIHFTFFQILRIKANQTFLNIKK